MFGEKLFTGVGYPTPVSIPEETTCLILQVPASTEWWALVFGVLYTLTLEWEWQQFEGGLTRDEALARWAQMLDEAYAQSETGACYTSVPTPFWDEDVDVDDEMPVATQEWYGYVTDPEAAPAELTFVEQVAIWSFTGFLAIATWEVGFAPAILFNTIAPNFVLAMRRGDLGEVIRILVDGEEVARVDTSGLAPGDVVRTKIVADESLSTHDIAIIQVSQEAA